MKNRARPGKGRGGDGQGKSEQDTQDHRAATAKIQPPRRDLRNGRPKYIQLWLIETRGRLALLSAAARGAYLSLLIEYCLTQAPLTDNAKVLCRISGIAKRDWPSIREELLEVFDLVDGSLVDDYADRRIAEFKAASTKGKANARKRVYVVTGLRDVAS